MRGQLMRYKVQMAKMGLFTRDKPKPTCLLPLVLISFCLLHQIQAVIQIGKVGVEPVKEDDIAMIFYANVTNTGSEEGDTPVAARLKMKSCCLKLSNGNENCEAMKLISGLGIVIHPNKWHTLRMYFPNPNLFDREGTCILQLLTSTAKNSQESWIQGKELSIPFSTVLPEPTAFRKLLIALGGSSTGYRVCNKHNRNARRECGNQDCLIRYNGVLSINNPTTGECEPTPQCSDSSKNMLNPFTGKCEPIKDVKELRDSFSHDMFSPNYINSPQHRRLLKHLSHPAQQKGLKRIADCEHGVFVNGTCVCNDGWRSMSEEEWIMKGGVVHSEEGFVLPRLCNIPLDDPMKRGRLFFIMLLIALTSLLLIMAIYCWGQTREQKRTKRDLRQHDHCRRSGTGEPGDEKCDEEDEDEDEEEEEEEEENPEKIINEILNRREQKPRSHQNRNQSSVPSLVEFEQMLEREFMERQSESKRESKTENQSISQIPTSHAQSTLNQDEIASPQMPRTPPNSSTGAYSVHPFVKDFLPEMSPSKIFEKRNTPSNTDVKDSASLSEEPQPQQASPPEPPADNGAAGSGSDIPTTNTVKRTPSTDEMLTMNRNEMSQAHIPMRPLPSLVNNNIRTTLPKVHEYNSGTGKVTITSMTSLSSEEVTLQKQEEWADYFKTVSPEDLELPVTPKSGHCMINVEDDEVSETRKKKRFLDFNFFNKDRGVGALKVMSLPEMKRVPVPEVKPPETKIKKSVEQLPPDEFANRQKAYGILRSLSRSKITDANESEVEEGSQLAPTKSSIWSNVASLNTEKPDPEKASRTSSSESVTAGIRSDSIFGDLGSDEDEEKALQSIAMAQGEQAKSKILEKDFKNYMKIYGFPQDDLALSTSKDQERDRILEADKIPSEVYFSKIVEEDSNNDNKIDDVDLKINSSWISYFLNSPNNQQLYYRRQDDTPNNNDNEGNNKTPTQVKSALVSSALKNTRSMSDSSINLVNNN